MLAECAKAEPRHLFFYQVMLGINQSVGQTQWCCQWKRFDHRSREILHLGSRKVCSNLRGNNNNCWGISGNLLQSYNVMESRMNTVLEPEPARPCPMSATTAVHIYTKTPGDVFLSTFSSLSVALYPTLFLSLFLSVSHISSRGRWLEFSAC